MAESPENPPSVDCNLLFAKALTLAGVTHMFGVVGVPVTAVGTRVVAQGIRSIAFHNEQSAGYAASAYGYLTGRPAPPPSSPSPAPIYRFAMKPYIVRHWIPVTYVSLAMMTVIWTVAWRGMNEDGE